MRKYFVLAALVVGGLFAGVQGAGAQSAILNLPRESQRASVSQRIGITDITINYHRPQVKGRKVLGPGSPQPYGQVWRAGANENTTINFTNGRDGGRQAAVEGRLRIAHDSRRKRLDDYLFQEFHFVGKFHV